MYWGQTGGQKESNRVGRIGGISAKLTTPRKRTTKLTTSPEESSLVTGTYRPPTCGAGSLSKLNLSHGQARTQRTIVIERIRDNIEGNPNIGAALACFPADIDEHWIWKAQRSAQIWRAGKSEQVVRVLFEIACGEPLHDGRSPRRTCANPRCVNPTHYELIPYRTNRYGADAPLPGQTLQAPGALQGGRNRRSDRTHRRAMAAAWSDGVYRPYGEPEVELR